MTGRETPSPDAVLHLLDEAGIPPDAALVRAVETIGSLKAGPAPEPTAELAQLMAAGGKTPAGRRNKRRITFIGGALAVSMGVGMSGVAAGTAFTDSLGEAVESITRFSIRDSADRAHPLPGARAERDESVVAPFVDGTARSLEDAVPAPTAEGDSGPAAHAGPSSADTGSVAHAAPRGPVDAAQLVPVDTAPAAAAGARAVAGPPTAVPPARQAPPAASLPAARPAAVPPAVSPVAPAGSSTAPGQERRATPASGGTVPGSPVPGTPVSGTAAPGSPAPAGPVSRNGKAGGSQVSGDGKAGDLAAGHGNVKAGGSAAGHGNGKAGSSAAGHGNGKAGGSGHEVRQMKQDRQQAAPGPEADPRGKGGSSAGARATPAPQGRVWLLAQADRPEQVPAAPVHEDPDQLLLGEPGGGEATSVPDLAPASTPGPPAEPVEERPASTPGSGRTEGEQPASGGPAPEQPVPGKPAPASASEQPAPDAPAQEQPAPGEPAPASASEQPTPDAPAPE